MNLKQLLRKLNKNNYRIEYRDGSLAKIYNPNPKLPFYSLHISGGEKAVFPLLRFSKKFWGVDLNSL